MALKIFHINTLGAYVIDAWQKELGVTGERDDVGDGADKNDRFADPTNAEYLVYGPKQSGVYTGGLLGDLTDELVEDLVFHGERGSLNRTKEVATTGEHDNRNGKNPSGGLKLKWIVTNSSTAQHSTTHSINAGLDVNFSWKRDGVVVDKVKGSDFERGFTIKFNYSYSWTDSEANTLTDTKEHWYEVNLDVPAGSVYKAVVMADKENADLPFSALVRLTGTSETNFREDVQGKKNHSTDAGTLCSWIKKYESAAWKNDRLQVEKDEMSFEQDEADPKRGIASVRGTMKVDQQVNFLCYVVDVTEKSADAVIAQLKRGETPEEIISVEPVPEDAAKAVTEDAATS